MLRNSFDWDWASEFERPCHRLPPIRTGLCLSKRPRDIVIAHLMLADPSIWFVYCQRDPRDIVASRHGVEPDRYWASLLHYRRARSGAKRCADHPRFVTVSYEDLVAAPDTVQEDLMSQIPWLKRTACFSEYHVRAQPVPYVLTALRGVRQVSSDSIGNWKNHLPRVLGQILMHGPITDDLLEQGYETDESWTEAFEGVLPDATPGVLPENRPLLSRIRRAVGDHLAVAECLARLAARRILPDR